MNDPSLQAAQDEVRITWRVVLGLTDPRANGWSRVRAAQLHELARLLPVIAFANILNAIVLSTVLWTSMVHWQIAAWCATILAVSGVCVVLSRRSLANDSVAQRRAMQRVTLASLCIGLLWIVPPTLFARIGVVDQQLAICLVLAAMMGSTTLTCSAVPAVMSTFVLVAAGGLSAMMARTGSPVMTVLPLLYALSLLAGGAEAARSFVSRRWAELALEEKQEVVKLLLREFEDKDKEPDWLWEVDTAKLLRRVSGRLARTARRTADELEGVSLLRLLAGERWEAGPIAPELSRLVELLNARESFDGFRLPVTIDGAERWWSLSAAPRYDDRGFAGFRGVGSDVTEQRRSTTQIEFAARYDALTGLSNRAAFLDAARDALGRMHRSGDHVALLLIDLDKFKPVNDTLGHPVGDRVLKHVADRMRTRIGAHGVAGRLGGDEFAVLVEVGDVGQIEAIATALIDAISEPFEIEGHLIRIGASSGSAVAPRDGRTIETLIRNADLALYRAKHDGRGRHHRFAPALAADADRRRQIESGLREALDHGGFRLVYQPVVDGDAARIEAFEALIRYTHPTLGDLAPADFLPVAVETRLSSRIGEWVLQTACAEAATWPAPLRVSINLTVEQLTDPALIPTVRDALLRSGLLPDRLEVEVSESALLLENAPVMAMLDRLQSLGVRITLDDFGSGYAALGYVRTGRFDAIKIDQAFVRGAARDEIESLAVVRAVVAMANSLGIPTIAEGMENETEYLRMRDLGCRRVQGHLAGAPMAADAVRALLAGPVEGAARSVA